MDPDGRLSRQTQRNLPDWLTLAAALWLFLTPFVGISDVTVYAAYNAFSAAMAIGLVALLNLFVPQPYGEAFNLTFGLWLIASPWVLGFGDVYGPATWNATLVGALVVVLAVWALDARTWPTALEG